MQTEVATYRIRIVATDGTLTRKKGLPDPRYPYHVRIERNGVLVGTEGACSWEERDAAVDTAIAQARGWIRRDRKERGR